MNQRYDKSMQAQTITSQALAAMRQLTTQEMLAVVGGPVIQNGGGGGIVAIPPGSSVG